ncbi:MAG: hypothetical protein RLZZ28_1666 [Bacteroidota bacterium]|jgi:hypothetical protein
MEKYQKKVYWLILIVSLVKIIAASLIELGNDEVYYWTYAIQPDWSHFDHPPMVGWLIRLTTLNLHWISDLSLRAGSIVCAAISTMLIFKTGTLVANPKTGWYAALIYNCSIYTGIIAGLFILPDSPQMPFWTAALYYMSKIILNQGDKKTNNWLILGLLVGLATLCKVHALYLWAGFGLFILTNRPQWLLNWRLYLGFLVTLVSVTPIVYWNIANNFITYRYHSERVAHTTVQWDMLGREIGGEFAYQNPVILVLIIVALAALINKKINSPGPGIINWLLCMSLPMIFLFWGVSLLNPTLPHWSGPAYLPLFLIAAIYLDKKTASLFPVFAKLAGGFLFFILIAGIALIRLSPVNFGSKEKENYGEYCPTLDLSGWKDFSKQFSLLVATDQRNGAMQFQSPILVNKWFPGGHIEFYTSRLAALPVIGIGNLDDLHKFAWLNRDRPALKSGMDAYAIVPSNLPANITELYGKFFAVIEEPVVIDQTRNGGVVRHFYIYRLKNCVRIPGQF